MQKSKQDILILLNHYEFKDEDVKNLKEIHDLVKEDLDLLLDGFYTFIFRFKHADFFIKDKETYEHHREKIGECFLKLFSGDYHEKYFNNLLRISRLVAK